MVIKKWTFLVLFSAYFAAILDDRPALKAVMECDEWNPTRVDAQVSGDSFDCRYGCSLCMIDANEQSR